MEESYARWRTLRAVPSIRAGMACALLGGWALLAVGFVLDPGFARGFWSSVAVSSPGFLVVLVAVGRWSDDRAIRAAVAAATLVWGAVLVWGTHRALAAPELGSIALVVVVLYGLQVFRVGPALAGPVVVVLGAVHVALLLALDAPDPAAGRVFHVSLAVVVVLASLLVARINDGAERLQFEQEQTIAAQTRVIEAERERADLLLRRILPGPVVDELATLAPGERLVHHHDEVTVMFADVVGFTSLSARLPAGDVVGLLDTLFGWIDELARRHGVEKVKTVGDAYMAVVGAPVAHADPAGAIARLALEVRDGVGALAARLPTAVHLRTGVATGDAVAGVLGGVRFTYDLWSDTVNTAARLQRSAPPGGILLDAATADRLRGRFHLLDLPPVDLKGKGPTAVWSLQGPLDPPPSRPATPLLEV